MTGSMTRNWLRVAFVRWIEKPQSSDSAVQCSAVVGFFAQPTRDLSVVVRTPKTCSTTSSNRVVVLASLSGGH